MGFNPVDLAFGNMDALYASNERLKAENAKLRELVRDLWEYIYIGTAQDGQSLHDRTRELGVSDHD